MAYSAERHARAQELFNRSTRSFYVRPHLTGPYHLRERASKRAAVVASWHDNDQDEDYQPSTKRTPTKRKLSLFHEDEPSPRSEKKARSLSPTSTLRSRLSPEMGEPSTPSQHSEPDSSDRYWATNPEIGTPNSRYSLRRRNKESVPGSPQKEDATNVATSSSKPTADNEILVRECAACQELGLECSLASDPNPFAYPCTTCEVDDVFCVVSPPPKWKRSCESCKGRKKEVCSYRYSDYDHSQPCLPCRNHGFECVAGPARHPPFALFSLSEPSEPGSSPNIDSPATSNSPYESSGLDSLEESKAREQMNSPNSNSPARPSSPHGYPEADGYEALKPIEEPRPMKANSPTISNSPHGSPEIEGPEASNPKGKRNSPKIDTLAGSNSPRSNAQSSVVDGPKPHEVIEITDSDDDTPGKQNSPSDISEPFDDLFDSPPPDTVSNIIASQSANTRRIWTELAHPVIFLADNRDGLFPCDWCNNFAYGITGLGPRNPEVLTLDDGTIVELQDGHIAEGKSQSRMCVDCTWARSKIIQCSHNSFGLLPTSLVPRDEVEKANTLSLLNDASEGLIDTETGQAGPYYPSPIYQWCSLCREPAIGSCQEVQPIDVHAAVVDCDAETHGCGLMLCEYCLNLAKRFKGDLNAVVAWGRNDPSQHVHYRADMEFILSGAEHNTFYRLYMQG